jgi:zinc transporter 1/2/3
MFEGLGLGSRLAILPLSKKYNWVAYVGAALYASITPLGIAIGLGVRTTCVPSDHYSSFELTNVCIEFLHSYDPESQTALVTSGILDSLSAGILIYTGLVELLAHDFIFNKVMASEVSSLISSIFHWSHAYFKSLARTIGV